MTLKIIALLVLAVLSAGFYRAGGSGRYPRWLRPAFCSAFLIYALMLFGFMHWSLVLVAGAQYGSLTTYFKRKGADAAWWNWALVGFIEALAVLPLIILSSHHNWLGFGAREAALTVLTAAWSLAIGKDVLEEFGRGALLILTIPLLLI